MLDAVVGQVAAITPGKEASTGALATGSNFAASDALVALTGCVATPALVAEIAAQLQMGCIIIVTGWVRHSVGQPVLPGVVSAALVRLERAHGWRANGEPGALCSGSERRSRTFDASGEHAPGHSTVSARISVSSCLGIPTCRCRPDGLSALS
jgi:hypothetical protein